MSDTIEVRVPDIGDFKDVPVIEVLVKAGDRVKKNESLITLESEKASMEVPAETDGVVHDVKVKVGDRVSQGSPILALSSDAAPAPAAPQKETPAPQEAAPPPRQAAAAQEASAPQAASESQPQAQTQTQGQDETPAPATADGFVHAGPAIRRLAREFGVELHQLRGSGPNGRITREDVQAFVKGSLQRTSAAPRLRGASGLAES